jgi:glycolate oxidase FAD binding subunit
VSTLTETLRRLEEIVGEAHLLTATESVAGYALDGQNPLAVAFPASSEQVAALLQAAGEAGLSVLLRGAGHHLHIGSPPSPIGLVVCLGRLARVVEYDPDDLTISAEAGISLQELQQTVGQRGQMLPLDPAGPRTATLGGIVAAGLSGPMRMRYGAPRDLVLGLRAALSSGEIIHAGGRTVKNVAGYDLTKLFVGSFGSVGAITEVTLRLTPAPEATALLAAAVPAAKASDVTAVIAASPLEIAACELLNSCAAARLERRLLPSTLADSCLICLGLAGPREAVAHQLQSLGAMIGPPCSRIEGDQEAKLWERLRALAYPSGNRAVLLRIGVPISAVSQMMALISARPGWSAVAHAAVGVLYASIEEQSDLQSTKQALDMLRRAAGGLGGFSVLESGPVDLKREFGVWGDQVQNRDVMQALKLAYDPREVLGCGRFVC